MNLVCCKWFALKAIILYDCDFSVQTLYNSSFFLAFSFFLNSFGISSFQNLIESNWCSVSIDNLLSILKIWFFSTVKASHLVVIASVKAGVGLLVLAKLVRRGTKMFFENFLSDLDKV